MTFATIFALVGGEAAAGAVLMTIILVAEFSADLNTERARASIKGLIGTVPWTARLRRSSGTAGCQPLLDDRRGGGVARMLRSILRAPDKFVKQSVGGSLGPGRSGEHTLLASAGIATELHLADKAP